MKLLTLFFSLIICFICFPIFCKNDIGKEVSEKNREAAILRENNRKFLYDFFEQDSVKTEQYQTEIKDGLKMMVHISIKKQRLSVLDFSDTFRIVLQTKISSGRKEGWTPKGTFKILKKRISRPSKKYGGVMTYWNCLTPNEAIAIHGLQNDSYELYLGRPLSHGCIRIGKDVEKEFYNLVPIGTKVVIE